MTSGREKMIQGRENCKNGREKKYNGLYRFGIFFCGQVLLEILEQHLKVIVYACGDWPMGLSNYHSMTASKEYTS